MAAVGDVDGDGSLDVFAPSGNGEPYVLFINDGSGVFTDEADVRMPAGPFPEGAAARMADVDDDGDLDIFSADAYAGGGPPFGHLYINDGLGVFTEAMGAIPGSISGMGIDDVELIDVDRDFDLDLFVNAHNGGTGALWLNDGSGVFTAGGSVDPPGNSGNHYNPAPCDVDGDGDLDLWIDNIGGNYTEQLLINDGAGNFDDQTSKRVTGNVAGADDNGVLCVDLDDDGDLDGVVISLAGPERFLENDGSGNFSYVPGVFPPPGDCSLWGEFGDLNDDDRSDLVTGQGECSSSDEVYLANAMVPADSHAPVILAVESMAVVATAQEPVFHFAVGDRTVTDEGPRLHRAWAVIDPSGAANEIDAWFMGGDQFRVVLPAVDTGTVVFQVCAEDRAGNVGCSEEQSYDVGDVPPGDSSGGLDGTGTAGDDSGTGNDTTVTAGTMTTAAGSETGSDAETDDAGADGGDGGGGCGCRSRGDAGSSWWMGLGLLGLGVLRRRRR